MVDGCYCLSSVCSGSSCLGGFSAWQIRFDPVLAVAEFWDFPFVGVSELSFPFSAVTGFTGILIWTARQVRSHQGFVCYALVTLRRSWGMIISFLGPSR